MQSIPSAKTLFVVTLLVWYEVSLIRSWPTNVRLARTPTLRVRPVLPMSYLPVLPHSITWISIFGLMLQMMPPPLSFFFFTYSRLSPTATAWFRNKWWVDSLFLLLWLPRRDFCSLFLLLWLSLGISAGLPAKRDLLEKILENWIWSCEIRTLNPHHFLQLKIFRRYRGLNPGLHSQSCLCCIYCKAALMQTWN